MQRGPFETKKDAYAALDTDFEREQLRQKDEWIFRATQLLRQSLPNRNTAKVETLLVLT